MLNNFIILFFCWFLFGFQHSFLAQRFFKDLLLVLGPKFVNYFYPFLYFLSQAIIYPAFYDLIITVKPAFSLGQISGNLLYCLTLIKYIGMIVLTSAVLSIDTNYFVGIKQIMIYIRGSIYSKFSDPKKIYSKSALFNYVRHPMYLGILLVFIGNVSVITDVYIFNLLFLMGYIYIGIYFEERQLVRDFPAYSSYKDRVAKINPLITIYRRYR